MKRIYLVFFYNILLIGLVKELIPYDNEKVTVLCILTFILTAYFFSRNTIEILFENVRKDMKTHYEDFVHSKMKILKLIRSA